MRAISRVRLWTFALQTGRPLLARQVNAQAPAITISMSPLLLANRKTRFTSAPRFNWNRSGQVLTELVSDELGRQAPAQECRQCRSTHAIALASQSSTPMAANLCRPYLPRLASILTVIAGSHLSLTSERRMCAEGHRPTGSPGRRSRDEPGDCVRARPEPASCVLARDVAADGRQSSAPAD